MTKWIDLSTPAAIRESVRKYRDTSTTEDERVIILRSWSSVGIPNQFAAMYRAAEMEGQ